MAESIEPASSAWRPCATAAATRRARSSCRSRSARTCSRASRAARNRRRLRIDLCGLAQELARLGQRAGRNPGARLARRASPPPVQVAAPTAAIPSRSAPACRSAPASRSSATGAGRSWSARRDRSSRGDRAAASAPVLSAPRSGGRWRGILRQRALDDLAGRPGRAPDRARAASAAPRSGSSGGRPSAYPPRTRGDRRAARRARARRRKCRCGDRPAAPRPARATCSSACRSPCRPGSGPTRPARAMPKSRIFTICDSRLTIRFAGFTSRWTMPMLVRVGRARRTRRSCISSLRRSRAAPDARMTSSSVSPGMYSIAMNGWPSCSPTS